MRLDILVPQWNETDEIIKPLLDSIALQQQVNLKDDVGVIIVNDGSETFLSEELLNSYPFSIKYIKAEHKGVSATRQRALDESTADYVMFCDADDMFYNMCGLWIIFNEMNKKDPNTGVVGFDSLTSVFVEETKMPDGSHGYINREMDSTFVHGKIHRRQYLIDQNIRWNPSLTIHEDSYFNILCQRLSTNVKYCPISFYLWKWRDNSICRSDFKYILKTYNNMLDSSTALVNEFLKRNKFVEAQYFAANIAYDAYFTMNKKEWINQENKQYRDNTEKRFALYYRQFKQIIIGLPEETKVRLLNGLRTRFYGEGMLFETITFNEWISHIERLV